MILQGDCRETLKTLAAESVSSIVTDPPYEIGFMGKGWDGSGVANDPTLWAECYRVLKPGGHVLAFGAARTYHRMACAIEDAGFEIRDSLHWVYGSGFPKSHNVGKKLDAWEGWGTALKPAHEPIVMARKPFPGTVASNVLEHGTGALNIDGARIRSRDQTQYEANCIPWTKWKRGDSILSESTGLFTAGRVAPMPDTTLGRWPANVLVTHSTECDGSECAPDCPAHEIDRQSGQTKSTQGRPADTKDPGGIHNYTQGLHPDRPNAGHNDSAAASRFYAQPEWAPGDYLTSIYTPKAGKKERNAGLDGMPERLGGSLEGGNDKRNGDKPQLSARANHHPTVKPVALMRYLIRLVTPPGGLVLDPFLGSGTTAVAAILQGFEWIGCELTAEYLPIIEARTLHAARDYPAINTIQNPDNSTQSQLGLFGELTL